VILIVGQASKRTTVLIIVIRCIKFHIRNGYGLNQVRESRSGSRRTKIIPIFWERKNMFMFWRAGFSLWRAAGFSWSLEVIQRGLNSNCCSIKTWKFFQFLVLQKHFANPGFETLTLFRTTYLHKCFFFFRATVSLSCIGLQEEGAVWAWWWPAGGNGRGGAAGCSNQAVQLRMFKVKKFRSYMT